MAATPSVFSYIDCQSMTTRARSLATMPEFHTRITLHKHMSTCSYRTQGSHSTATGCSRGMPSLRDRPATNRCRMPAVARTRVHAYRAKGPVALMAEGSRRIESARGARSAHCKGEQKPHNYIFGSLRSRAGLASHKPSPASTQVC